MARAVRHGQRTGLVTLAEDAYDTADIIRRDLLTKARESEGLKAFAARCNEQVRRIAALYALFDLRSQITVEDLEAAAALVTYAMDSVLDIVGDTGADKPKRQPLSLVEKVRARIAMHGGKATSSQVLPFVNASAAEVKALPGIAVTTEKKGNGGRPAVVFTLADDEPQCHADAQPASTQSDNQQSATVLRMDAYRPAPQPDPEPRPVKRSALLEENPFLALL
ncbi:DUF3987 domain-containing protein [Streptomyces caatingaensis]|uniref:Uncharacterized protein n=1 Tax=Streptomyces caatingaensis TaxID=1678637 RepID=A0A0K9XHK4_9ACTN|nr:DUF3987 domain-containing protein [Streptomyces caatingaensis]KNB52879.1 hypothetical protein AC230_09615 [Streptomyces caatingaensis]